ncbi:MAG TPA: acyl-ACP thioesterase [Clostridiaceae bacterium]|mgnify:FL=1|jgi:acyl-ACP thioesterase|nr:acyl-ACP thioesterase [Clostridiaceae bacterium]HBF77504.1 acyl-ACP thioesterase [Clostridiaceae bacterium]HBG38885.1 acyl-ACP thioesterase [Clostridiaceae bacterium]HBN28046.1 acyl-ACP thioesterase [Clostridiaceae bacterium]HBX47609.1 acyl-ACP thioesterase [Clostridiaceae bacterium]
MNDISESKKLKFKKTFEVGYYEINKNDKATPTSILNYLEETAVEHSESIGYGVKRLKENGFGWVITHCCINMERGPMWNEKITVETWASGFNKFYATREFCIRDANENIIGRATSLWIFFDIEKRRPVRIPDEITEAFGYFENDRGLDVDFRKFRPNFELDNSKQFFVRRSDIDTNEHVNNVKYVEWMLETIPKEAYDNYILEGAEVLYKKETYYGETILSSCTILNEDDDKCEFGSSITSVDGKEKFAFARSVWRKK